MVDWDAALENAAGSQPLLAELVEVALEELPNLERGLDEALAEGNAPEVQRTAHTIKGTGRVFADTVLIEAASKVEELAAEGHLDQVPPPREELAAEVARFLVELQEFEP